MLAEMKYIEGELLPRLREQSGRYEKNARKQLAQWRGEKGIACILLHAEGLRETEKLPVYNQYEIHFDPEKMFVNELRSALSAALSKGDAVPSVRANVGCGALCTLYGGLKQTFFEDKMPWLLTHLSEEEIGEITVSSLSESDEFRRGLEQMRYMKEMLKGTGVGVYPMDLQGPIDMAHLLMGDAFFYALYDDPELVRKVLDMAVAACIYGMEKCFEIIEPKDYVCHYNNLVLPAETPLKISEDTSTLLSGAHLDEFMRPYTEKLLAHFGGGYIHYCGNNPHLLKMMPEIDKSIGLNFGNPERHDAKEVLDALKNSGKCYYGAFLGMTVEEQVKLSKCEDGRYVSFIPVRTDEKMQDEALERFHNALG